MNRRDSVLALLAMGAAGGRQPAFAQAQPAREPFRIGLVPDQRTDALLKLFASALRELGRIEGRDYVFHRSGVFYGPDTQLAVDRVVEAKPDLILTGNLGYAIAVQKASMAVPVVLYASGFPVQGGVADSLTRPGKNVTGLTLWVGGETFGKLVQLVHEAKPSVTRIGVFMSYVPPFHPRAETDLIIQGMKSAARPLGIDVRVFEISTSADIDNAFAAAVEQRIEAMVLTSDPSMMARKKDVLQFSIARRLPTIADVAVWDGDVSPLLVYSASYPSLMRQAAPYVNQILWNGVKPGDLPIQLPSRFEFLVNLKTAKMIGLTVPPSILVRADTVIRADKVIE